jgi:hypothetical protein
MSVIGRTPLPIPVRSRQLLHQEAAMKKEADVTPEELKVITSKLQSDGIEIESVLNTLEKIALNYDKNSQEYQAVEVAAKAAAFAFDQQVQSTFRSFLANFRPLTAKERAHLASMNIDPDDDAA